MTTDREHLAALETAYWNEIVTYFEAMPEYQRPPSYKKYAGIREIIALSQNERVPTAKTVSRPVTITAMPESRSLTQKADKHAIHETVAAYFVRRGNKASLMRDILSALLEQGVCVPGKTPVSTLAALISRNSSGMYKKVGDGYWHLNDAYYLRNGKEYQSGKTHFENGKGASSLTSSAPFISSQPQ